MVADRQQPLPLFDLFLDLPHPGASAKCPPHFAIPPPRTPAGKLSDVLAAEIGEPKSIARIARFAFPEHDDRAYAQELESKKAYREQQVALGGGGSGLNRFDFYSRDFAGFQHHAFSLQLQSGTRIRGHVRRYLPHHLSAKTRFDVGRRGVRAMVVLTRFMGGDKLYASILKSVEAISSQQSSTPADWHPCPGPQQAFMYAVHVEHAKLCATYATADDKTKSKAQIIMVSGAEFGNKKHFLAVDNTRYAIPTTLLRAQVETETMASDSLLLPLLRCVGVSHTLRLMSAMMCERRIIILSKSPARLAACSRAAVSILAQGLLKWQHLYIPVLPPGLLQYLAAPMPYVVGVLSNFAPTVKAMRELGEVLVVDLDVGGGMETRGVAPGRAATFIPDLLRGSLVDEQGQRTVSVAEVLAQDLNEVIKVDKKYKSGDISVSDTVGKAASKAVGGAKKFFGNLKKNYQAQKATSMPEDSDSTRDASAHSSDNDAPGEGGTLLSDNSSSSGTWEVDDYPFGEGYENESAEEGAKVAFATFFVCVLGDMRWYPDKDRFLAERKIQGDVEGTPMFPLLHCFAQTQIFEQFGKARAEELKSRAPVAKDASLFSLCAEYLRTHRLDMSPMNVRRVTRQVAQSNPSRYLIQQNQSARRRAMALTSNARFDGDPVAATAELSEQCREASTMLFEVMSVVWLRLRDCHGMQWKHALQGLNLLRNLLLHGPLSAVTEATDGLDKIRLLKSYSQAMRAQQRNQVRLAASQVYALLVDRSTLFSQRRACADRRRLGKMPRTRRPKRDPRFRLQDPFKNLHAAAKPGAPPPGTSAALPRTASAPAAAPAMDLLGKSIAPGMTQQKPSPAAAAQPATNAYANELLSFDFTAEAGPAGTQAEAKPDVTTMLEMFNVSAESAMASAPATTPAPPAVVPANAAPQPAQTQVHLTAQQTYQPQPQHQPRPFGQPAGSGTPPVNLFAPGPSGTNTAQPTQQQPGKDNPFSQFDPMAR